ncbi:MAG TPA: choice-of-anchor L domain-containing protein [Solirubrobacterales bacterium]|nr:choice-of-anchor L domain-containing protein [Solirubrobacterales bacterium]
MKGTTPTTLLKAGALTFVAALFFATGSASAGITPTSNGEALTDAIDDGLGDAVVNSTLLQEPPNGNPAAVSDSELALMPFKGGTYTMLSSGDTTAADDPDNSEALSNDNGGSGGAHGGDVFDLVTLRVDLDVPDDVNCLTIDYRFLTEEFDEFVGSDFNDAFLAELDNSSFVVQGDGSVLAPQNFAVGPDGAVTTVNTAGTSADNALGTTYDGATPVLRATTPITPGEHSVFLSTYDASDAIYDSTAFVDNMRLRNVDPENCVAGAANNPIEDRLCQGEEPTVFAVNGFATGTKKDDVILGTGGSEVIRGRGGDDTICAAGGNDKVRGNQGDDTIVGNKGGDDLRGNLGDDTIRGSRGNDTISGQNGKDVAFGGRGRDTVNGGKLADKLVGNAGSDVVRGRSGDDLLRGGKNSDRLRGGTGTDKCRTGRGNNESVKGCEE